MSRSLRVVIPGKPQQQGSKTAYVVKGRAVMTEANKNLMPWRTAAIPLVHQACIDQFYEFPEPDQPVTLAVAFYYDKPKTAKREQPTVKPDLDHLIRAVGDLLTQSGAVSDDSQIVAIIASKHYGEARTEITIKY